MNLGRQVEIITDASPWGLGGYLVVDRKIESYFSSELTTEDLTLFDHERGDCRGQQTWEGLAMLVALRLWANEWLQGRVRLRVRGDSVTMLTAVMHMKANANSSLVLIAREVALDVAESAYAPDVGGHLPGDANTTADALSRKCSPEAGQWQLPGELRGRPRGPAHPRGRARTIVLSAPPRY